MPTLQAESQLQSHELQIADPDTGHTVVTWDKDEKDMNAAKKIFDDLLAKGYLAYTVSDDNNVGEVVKTFDPKLLKIALVPPMAGG